jgi:CheY-like chemotaxis protein
MKVLIFETNSVSAAVITELSTTGVYEFEISGTVDDLLMKVNQKKYHLVLLNIDLSQYTRSELIPKLKEIQPDIKIVAMTDYNSRELELNIRQQGVSFYIVKPVTKKEVKAILTHFSKKETDF